MPVILYAPTTAAEQNLKQVFRRLFSGNIVFQNTETNNQILVLLQRPPHIKIEIQSLVKLFEFNNPREHFASVVASAAMAIEKYKWQQQQDKIGQLLKDIDSPSYALVHLGAGSQLTVTRFRRHPHPQLAAKGFIIATGPGLPAGGIVRVGSGNKIYSRLYGHAGRQMLSTGRDALINGIVNNGFNTVLGGIFTKLLVGSGLLSSSAAGQVWDAIGHVGNAKTAAPLLE